MAKVIAFDFNGTLVGDNDHQHAVLCHHIELGLGNPPTMPEFLRTYQPPYLDYVRSWGGMVPSTQAWDVWDVLIQELGEPGLHAGVLPLLEYLVALEVPIYVVSANQKARVEAGLEKHGILQFFQAIYGDDEHKEVGLQKIIGDHGISPRELMYVGDMRVDMYAARAVGAVGIGIGAATGYEAEHCLILREAGATHPFRSMTAFHNALMNGLED